MTTSTWTNGMHEETWDAALELAAKLIEPKPLKSGADGFDRLAHKVSTADAKAIRALKGKQHLARAIT